MRPPGTRQIGKLFCARPLAAPHLAKLRLLDSMTELQENRIVIAIFWVMRKMLPLQKIQDCGEFITNPDDIQCGR